MTTENKKDLLQAGLVIVSALIWAAVMIAGSWVLDGTGQYGTIKNILLTGAVVRFLALSTPTLYEKRVQKSNPKAIESDDERPSTKP